MKICNECNYANSDYDNYCMLCGANLNINKPTNQLGKKEIVSSKCSALSTCFLLLASLPFTRYARGYYYMCFGAICFLIGAVLDIISILYNRRNKLGNFLMWIYIILTITVITFWGLFGFVVNSLGDL